MKFAVSELTYISILVPFLSTREYRALSAMLHRRQPDFCGIIDDVAKDPRCVQAHEFCTRFCAIAFKYAEEDARSRLPRYSRYEFEEVARAIARGEEAKVGKRACGFRNRIARHVLSHYDFDNDDTEWLCTTISAFLFLTESSMRRENGVTNLPVASSRRHKECGAAEARAVDDSVSKRQNS